MSVYVGSWVFLNVGPVSYNVVDNELFFSVLYQELVRQSYPQTVSTVPGAASVWK